MKRIVTVILSAVMLLTAVAPADVSAAPQSRQQTSASKKKKKAPAGKQPKKQGKKTAAGSRKRNATRQETSADVKRRQQAAQQEIKKTQAEIAANDKAVKTGLDNLGRINADINAGKKQLADITTQVNTLDRKIGTMQTQIAAGEKDLARMREKYLDAVRKVRLKKGKQSTLAFIFSSESFSQAMRRMRYLKQFSEWRDRQSAQIDAKVKGLRYQTQLLGQTKADKSKALTRRLATQQSLEQQRAKQDVVVAELKKNGQALRSHLARKQSEANDLRNRVAALIAQEQAAAEARRKEEERRQEQARIERERREAEERERRQLIARAEAEKAAESKEEEKTAPKPKKDKEKTDSKKDKDKEKKKKEADRRRSEPRKQSGGEYAEARKRRQRGDTQSPAKVPATSKVEKGSSSSKKASYGNFAAAKGNLPRPVSGAFKVVSPFGRHPLPDLPDVVYDNPGIDAQVSQGASAQAVFAGRVSGVYMLPGYNTVVIVNHGGYYTIYGNIAAAAVKVGDSVKQGQALGRLATDPDTPGHSSIHFEIWKNREKLNPMNWIR